MRKGIGGINMIVGMFGFTVEANHRFGQTMRMGNIIKAKAAFDAETIMIGRTIAPNSIDDFVVFHFISDLTANPAIRAK